MNRRSTRRKFIGLALVTSSVMTALVSASLETVSARSVESARESLNFAQTGFGITVNPTVSYSDGVIRGSFQATSTNGRQLTFKFMGSSSGGKMVIGNVPTSGSATDPQSFTVLPYANWLDGAAKGIEKFKVRVSPATGNGLTVAEAAKRSLNIIVSVNVGSLAPGNTPVAMTYKVSSFDGTGISTNFFPASGLRSGDTAATLLNAPDLGSRGETDPYAMRGASNVVPGPAFIRNTRNVGDNAYNLVTWDPRGTFASGGSSQFGSSYFDGRDTSAIIDWITSNTPATLNGFNDPMFGIFGAGFGGNIALVVGATDPRVDAIVPTSSWFSMDSAFHQNGIFRSAAASSMLTKLKNSGVRINSQIASGLLRGSKTGKLSDSVRAVLASIGVSINLNQSQAPVFFVQNMADPVSRLSEMMTSAERTLANPYGTPVKSAWLNLSQISDSAFNTVAGYSKSWFNKYVAGIPIPDAYTPNFQWWDQQGNRYTNSLAPFETGFNRVDPAVGTSSGGLLGTSHESRNSLSRIKVPVTFAVGNSIVGAPTVTFTYTGRGSRSAVFARIVNKVSGSVIGPVTTPVPVTLDGKTHTVSVEMSEIVWSVLNGKQSTLEMQLLAESKSYPHGGSGAISISNVQVSIPVVG